MKMPIQNRSRDFLKIYLTETENALKILNLMKNRVVNSSDHLFILQKITAYKNCISKSIDELEKLRFALEGEIDDLNNLCERAFHSHYF